MGNIDVYWNGDGVFSASPGSRVDVFSSSSSLGVDMFQAEVLFFSYGLRGTGECMLEALAINQETLLRALSLLASKERAILPGPSCVTRESFLPSKCGSCWF